jgi:ParB-like chromosome segregation protein Spo0J
MNVKEIAIGKVNPANYNPRIQLQPGDEEFEKLKAVILEYGFVQPLVVNTRTGNLVGGHQRLGVAKHLKMKKVPVTEVDLSEAEEKKLNLALNKVSGTWDEGALGALLNDLKGSGEDLGLTGFDDIEIEELTMAFADDLPFMDDDVYHDEPGEFEESEEEDELDPYEEEERGYVIQYNIVFDDEVQQETFQSFLKMLKDEYNNDAFPSHASRIHAFLKKEAIPRLNTLKKK